MLHQLTREKPLKLPQRADLLSQPKARRFHQNVETLDLHAFLLVRDS